MKRQELKTLLHGVENAGEIIDQIMELNGADIENAKKQAGTDAEKLTADNERLTAQLKAYEEGGEKYVDPTEFARLKKFETDTKAAQKRTAAEVNCLLISFIPFVLFLDRANFLPFIFLHMTY